MLPENPFPACPSSPNCYRESRAFPGSPDAAFDAAIDAVRNLHGLTIGRTQEIKRDGGCELHATCKVLLFTDDLHVRVDQHNSGTAVHVRSASRAGYGDFGVNRRRVRALFDHLEGRLGASH